MLKKISRRQLVPVKADNLIDVDRPLQVGGAGDRCSGSDDISHAWDRISGMRMVVTFEKPGTL